MNKVTYRPFEECDCKAIGRIIGGLWHPHFSEEIMTTAGKFDLVVDLQRATYSCVAEVDGEAVGVVLGRFGMPNTEHQAYWSAKAQREWTHLKELDPEVARNLNAYRESESAINQQLLTESDCDDRFKIVLFILGEGARGLGIGRSLFDRAEAYFREAGASEVFLYTDTSCTFGFYDHRGLQCAAEYQPINPEKDGLLKRYFLYVDKL